ncbi:MAG: hypothetical protein VB119_06965 [Candidatus Metalachnospira sp.]|nr:hypothetical protein [Candidatus Metalachnospira sp.]
MGYFIHNKYDVASITALAGIDTGVHTVIDYYTNYETYKYLDVSAGFGKIYDALTYVTPSTQIYGGQALNNGSHFNFSSSLIIKSIQRGNATANSAVNTNIVIADVVPSKTFVFILPLTTTGIKLMSVDKNFFTVYAGSTAGFSYQVIEFK